MNRLILIAGMILSITSFARDFDVDKHVSYCPPPGSFSKNPKTLTWVGPQHWKSFNPSFAKKLTRFKRAQWQGTNVGVILCTYVTDNASAFPVFIQAPGSYIKPSTKQGNWIAKHEAVTCTKNDRLSCAFYRIHEHKTVLQTHQDVINFLDEVKDAPKPIPNLLDQ